MAQLAVVVAPTLMLVSRRVLLVEPDSRSPESRGTKSLVALVEVDGAGRLTWVGEDWPGLFGHPAEGLVGRSLSELLGRPGVPPGDWSTQGRFEVSDGAGEAVAITVHLEPRESGGWSGALVADHLSVNARVEAQAQAILDNVVDAVVTIDTGGVVGSFNRAAQAMFGYRPDEIIGQPVSTLMPEPHASLHPTYLLNYLNSGIRRIIGIGRELQGLHRSGRRFPIWLAVSEVTVDGERSFTGIIRELTDQHESARELARAHQRLARMDRLSTLGEMTAGIAHEVNQPLTAISMYATVVSRLLGSGADPSRVNEVLGKLAEQSRRAGSVINHIQRFVSSQEIEPGDVDINALVQSALTLGESDVRFHQASIETGLCAGLPKVRCDSVQIQQVLLNLVRNAIDAMDEIGFSRGNRITIRTFPDGDHVRVEVEDRGSGVHLPADEIFSAFRTTKKHGMGMGLAICRTIVGNHGGRLEYENHKSGARFWFTLPTVDGGSDG